MNPSEVDASTRDFLNQLQKLDLSNNANGSTENVVRGSSTPTSNSSRASGSRSVSSAGIIRHQSSSLASPAQSGAQTAPTASGNYYGFSYPYNYQYSNNFVYSNNNSMYPPTVTTVDQNLLFHPTGQPNYARSLSPLPSALNPSTSETEIVKTDSNKECGSNVASQPKIPPRPTGYGTNFMQGAAGSIVYVPRVSLNTPSHSVSSFLDTVSGIHSPPPQTISESPENSASFHLHPTEPSGASVSPNIQRKNLDFQLHVNVESNDTSNHDWRPFQTFSPHSQQVVPSLPFQLSPGFNSYQPLYQPGGATAEQMSSNSMPMPSPIYVPIPFPPMAYPTNMYYQVPNSGQLLLPSYDVQQYVNQQRHYLNVLRYEFCRNQEEIESHKNDIADLEKSLRETSSLPNKAEIEKLNTEISKLRLECYCLCAEVDEHYEGRVPLGEVNRDFYSCINTGQEVPISHTRWYVEVDDDDTRKGQTKSENPGSLDASLEDEENKETSKWTCPKCTFQNHPAISVCEMCQVGENVACSS